MESLTSFGLSVEYFGVFQSNIVKLRSFHFGDTLEFSFMCAVRHNFRKIKNSALILEKVLKAILKRPR
jgi:hypothetical protein